jgi:hypothetical protein
VKCTNEIALIPFLKSEDNTFHDAGRRDMCHAILHKQFLLSQVGRKPTLLREAAKQGPKEIINSERMLMKK